MTELANRAIAWLHRRHVTFFLTTLAAVAVLGLGGC